MKRLVALLATVLLLLSAPVSAHNAPASAQMAAHAVTAETLCVEGWTPEGTWWTCR